MYHPSRGGVRGGTDQFSWDAVKTDKHRENYLGHSVMAPVGRWQKGKDLSWYAKERKPDDTVERSRKAEEFAAIKKTEEEARLIALGYKPAKKVEQALGKEEIVEILKLGLEDRSSTNIERVQGVGVESSRAAMLIGGLSSKKDNKGISFETEHREKLEGGQKLPEEVIGNVSTSETSEKHSRSSRKEKKHKKKKKKHKKQLADSGEWDSDVKSAIGKCETASSRCTKSLNHKRTGKPHHDTDSDHDASSSHSKKRHHSQDKHKKHANVSKSPSKKKKQRHHTTSDDDSPCSDLEPKRRAEMRKEVEKYKSHKSASSSSKAEKIRYYTESDSASSIVNKYRDKHRTSKRETESQSTRRRRRHDTSESD